jgi:kynureninase
MADVQAKGRALGDVMIKLYDERLVPLGFGLSANRDGSRRGNHVSITHAESYRIMQALIARGVIGDFRAPDVMRFGFGPLYVRYVDIFDAVSAITDIMHTATWKTYPAPQSGAVT